jgi:ribosomal protein L22
MFFNDYTKRVFFMAKGRISEEYKRSIKPQMNVVSEVAKQFKIPMFATFQVDPNTFESFCLNEERSNFNKIKYMAYLHETWSLDEFMEKVIDDAIKNGHDSALLNAMGIPKRPLK